MFFKKSSFELIFVIHCALVDIPGRFNQFVRKNKKSTDEFMTTIYFNGFVELTKFIQNSDL